jgi:zinc protease
LRDREGLTYGVTSAFLSAARLPGPWRVTVSVNPANVERAVDLVREVLARVCRSGTERARTDGATQFDGRPARVALATSGGIAAQLERMSYYALADDEVDTYRARLEAVSHADVLAAVQRYLCERNLVVVAAGTFAS